MERSLRRPTTENNTESMIHRFTIENGQVKSDEQHPETSGVSSRECNSSESQIQTTNPGLLCRTCDKLDFVRLFDSRVSFETVKELVPSLLIWDFDNTRTQRSSCSFCRMLHDVAERHMENKSTKLLTHIWASTTYLDGGLRAHRAIDVEFRLQDGHVFQGPRIVARASSTDDHQWKGRVMNMIRIDRKLVASWLRLCEDQHDNRCKPRVCNMPFVLLVIDVERDCIIEAPLDCRYLTLSYVWGSLTQPRLTMENYSRFTTDGAISKLDRNIPKTIRDAMILCSILNERYLWVDSLCICQDDEKGKQLQIKHMNLIYSSSVLTIAAAAGTDSNAGLTGLSDKSEPRGREQCYGEASEVQLVTVCGDVVDTMLKSYWNRRGWTLQERILSKRLLVFTESQVFFCCSQALWREDMCLELSLQDGESLFQRDKVLPFLESYNQSMVASVFQNDNLDAAFLGYVYIVEDYTQRELSCASDSLNAFAGIAAALEKSLGRFHYGLPLDFFSISLLFAYRPPALDSENCSNFRPWDYLRRPGFPSWSGGQLVYRQAAGCLQIRELSAGYLDYQQAARGLQEQIKNYGGKSNIMAGPDWFHFQGTRVVPLATESRDPGSLILHPVLQQQWAPQVIRVDVQQLQQTRLGFSHLLFCWTGAVPIFTDGRRYTNLKVVEPSQGRSSLWVENVWEKVPPGTIELISICYDSSNLLVFLMLVHWVDGIAYRLKTLDWPMHVEDWVHENPKRKLIILG